MNFSSRLKNTAAAPKQGNGSTSPLSTAALHSHINNIGPGHIAGRTTLGYSNHSSEMSSAALPHGLSVGPRHSVLASSEASSAPESRLSSPLDPHEHKSEVKYTWEYSLLLPATPEEVRQEVDVLLADLIVRLKQLLFNSLLCAYYVGFIPMQFADVSPELHVHLFHVAIETKTSKPKNSASIDQRTT